MSWSSSRKRYLRADEGDDAVLWLGSDNEDYPSPSERRRRIKKACLRVLEGEEPVLLTTLLKGPFDSQSGWENPWRSKRRTLTANKTLRSHQVAEEKLVVKPSTDGLVGYSPVVPDSVSQHVDATPLSYPHQNGNSSDEVKDESPVGDDTVVPETQPRPATQDSPKCHLPSPESPQQTSPARNPANPPVLSRLPEKPSRDKFWSRRDEDDAPGTQTVRKNKVQWADEMTKSKVNGVRKYMSHAASFSQASSPIPATIIIKAIWRDPMRKKIPRSAKPAQTAPKEHCISLIQDTHMDPSSARRQSSLRSSFTADDQDDEVDNDDSESEGPTLTWDDWAAATAQLPASSAHPVSQTREGDEHNAADETGLHASQRIAHRPVPTSSSLGSLPGLSEYHSTSCKDMDTEAINATSDNESPGRASDPWCQQSSTGSARSKPGHDTQPTFARHTCSSPTAGMAKALGPLDKTPAKDDNPVDDVRNAISWYPGNEPPLTQYDESFRFKKRGSVTHKRIRSQPKIAGSNSKDNAPKPRRSSRAIKGRTAQSQSSQRGRADTGGDPNESELVSTAANEDTPNAQNLNGTHKEPEDGRKGDVPEINDESDSPTDDLAQSQRQLWEESSQAAEQTSIGLASSQPAIGPCSQLQLLAIDALSQLKIPGLSMTPSQTLPATNAPTASTRDGLANGLRMSRPHASLAAPTCTPTPPTPRDQLANPLSPLPNRSPHQPESTIVTTTTTTSLRSPTKTPAVSTNTSTSTKGTFSLGSVLKNSIVSPWHKIASLTFPTPTTHLPQTTAGSTAAAAAPAEGGDNNASPIKPFVQASEGTVQPDSATMLPFDPARESDAEQPSSSQHQPPSRPSSLQSHSETPHRSTSSNHHPHSSSQPPQAPYQVHNTPGSSLVSRQHQTPWDREVKVAIPFATDARRLADDCPSQSLPSHMQTPWATTQHTLPSICHNIPQSLTQQSTPATSSYLPPSSWKDVMLNPSSDHGAQTPFSYPQEDAASQQESSRDNSRAVTPQAMVTSRDVTPPPSTPELAFTIKPFSAFMSLSPDNRVRKSRRSLRPALSSGKRGISSRKVGLASRRVSWGDVHDSVISSTTPSRPSTIRKHSPPPETAMADIPSEALAQFKGHFAAVGKRVSGLRQRLLPTASQMALESPAHDAMAKAFILADDAQKRHRSKSKSPEESEDEPMADADDRPTPSRPNMGPANETSVDMDDDESLHSEEHDIVREVVNNLDSFLDTWDVEDEMTKEGTPQAPRTADSQQSPWGGSIAGLMGV